MRYEYEYELEEETELEEMLSRAGGPAQVTPRVPRLTEDFTGLALQIDSPPTNQVFFIEPGSFPGTPPVMPTVTVAGRVMAGAVPDTTASITTPNLTCVTNVLLDHNHNPSDPRAAEITFPVIPFDRTGIAAPFSPIEGVPCDACEF